MTTDELAIAVAADVANKTWYAHGSTPLGGSDYWTPQAVIVQEGEVRITGETANFGKRVTLDQATYEKLRELGALRKVGLFLFVPWGDPAASFIERAEADPETAGRCWYEACRELDQLKGLTK